MGNNRRVKPEGGGQHRGANGDALGARQGGGHPGRRERGMAVGVFPGLKMVADEDRFKAGLFRFDGEAQQGVWRELFSGSLVTEAHTRSPMLAGQESFDQTVKNVHPLSARCF